MNHKRYYCTTTEEMVLNKDFYGFRGGRIECYDTRDKNYPYAVYEARFLVPEKLYDKFIEVWDGVYVDDISKIYLRWDYGK